MECTRSKKQSNICPINKNPDRFNISNNVVKHRFQSLLALAETEYHNSVTRENEYQELKEELKRREWKEMTDKESLERQKSDLRNESKTLDEYVEAQVKEIKLDKDKVRAKISDLKESRQAEFDSVKISRMFWTCFESELSDFKENFKSRAKAKIEQE